MAFHDQLWFEEHNMNFTLPTDNWLIGFFVADAYWPIAY